MSIDRSPRIHYVCQHCFYMVGLGKIELDELKKISNDPKSDHVPCPNCGTRSEKSLAELLKEMEEKENE